MLGSLASVGWPSFWVSYGIAAATIVALLVWLFIDASFTVALDLALIDLRLRPHPGMDLSWYHRWNQLGSRLALLAVLTTVGAVATITIVARVFMGHSRGGTVVAVIGAMALLTCWCVLIAGYRGHRTRAFYCRLSRRLPQLRDLAARLEAQWPIADVDIPPFGTFLVDAKTPEVITLLRSHMAHSTADELGPLIRRRKEGGVRLDFSTCSLEFLPAGSVPATFRDEFPDWIIVWELVHSTLLGNGAFLATYEGRSADDSSPASTERDGMTAVAARRKH